MMSLLNASIRRGAAATAALASFLPAAASAADSYRWLHVTIDTPWAIFIFLLPMVLTPLVLMAVLYWRFATKPEEKNNGRGRGAKRPRSSDDTV